MKLDIQAAAAGFLKAHDHAKTLRDAGLAFLSALEQTPGSLFARQDVEESMLPVTKSFSGKIGLSLKKAAADSAAAFKEAVGCEFKDFEHRDRIQGLRDSSLLLGFLEGVVGMSSTSANKQELELQVFNAASSLIAARYPEFRDVFLLLFQRQLYVRCFVRYPLEFVASTFREQQNLLRQ